MITIERKVTVEDSQTNVFEFVGDFQTTEVWDPGVSSAHRHGTDPIQVGTTYTVNAVFAGKTIPMTYEVLEYDPPKKVLLRGEGPAVVVMDDIRVHERNGKSTVTYHADFSMKGFRKIAEPFMKGLFVKLADDAMEGLESSLKARAHPT